MPLAPHVGTSKPNGVGRNRHFILRGFRLHLEAMAFKALVKNPDLGDKAIRSSTWMPKTPWRLHLSATFYLCLVLGLPAAGRKLSPEDSGKLHSLANAFAREKELKPLCDLASGRIPMAEYENKAVGAKVIERALEKVVMAADIPVTTPSLSHFCADQPCKGDREEREAERKRSDGPGGEGPEQGVYNVLKLSARWVILDEAGAMGRADALTVQGNTGRPCILCGDHRQLRPFVCAPRGEDDAGNVVNRHVEDASVSALAWHHHCGMPVYRMLVQLRMACGQFDLAREIIYSDFKEAYGKSSDIGLLQHQPGHVVEELAREWYKDIKPSPAGKLFPVFIDCPGKLLVDPVSKSKSNPVQNELALRFAAALVDEKGVDASTIVMITPYTRNAEMLNRRIKRDYPCLQGMRKAATVDSFQGSEGDISFYVSVARSGKEKGKGYGPGFTSDKNRLNVAITRQRCALVIIGDINILGKPTAGKPKAIDVEGPNGEMCKMNPGALKELCSWMTRKNRVGKAAKPDKAAKPAKDIEDKLAEGVEDVEVEVEVEAEDKGKGKARAQGRGGGRGKGKE